MKKLQILTLLLLLPLSLLAQTTLYVSESGSGNNDGSDWDNALPGEQLQAAINQLESETQQNAVFVAHGTYKPTLTLYGNSDTDSSRYFTFSMKKGVIVYGGFSDSNEASPDERILIDTDEDGNINGWEFEYPTILSGELQDDSDSTNNTYNLVSFVGCDSLTSIIDGVTIQSAYNELARIRSYTSSPRVYAAGIYSESGQIKNCIITKCFTNNTNSSITDNDSNQIHIYGSGIFAVNTLIESCKIEYCNAHANRNFGSVYGGGALLNNTIISKLYIDHCSITTKSGYLYLSRLSTYGGGAYIHKSYLDDCHVTNCSNTNMHYGGYDYPIGGGAYLRSCRITNSSFINNSTFANHDVSNGGGIFIGTHSSDDFPDAGMYNCIIANNTCTGKSMARGGGVIMQSYGTDWYPFPFANNTICNNMLMATSGTNLYGSGIDCSNGYWHEQVAVTIKNCIIWGNRKPASDPNDQINVLAGSTIENNAIEGYTGSETSNIALTASNDNTTDNVPYFMNPTSFPGAANEASEFEELDNANWWIEEGSSCIDSGTVDTTGMSIPGKAYYGNYRIFGEHIDIGAAEFAKFTILASADEGGTIDPAGDSIVSIFDRVEYTIDHLESHSFVSMTLTGEAMLAEEDGKYILSNVTTDCELLVETTLLTFTLTSTAGEHGSVSPSSVVVNYGSDQTFTIDPDDNYEIDAASFMGSDVKTEISQNGEVFEYTASSVLSDGNFNVTFKVKVGVEDESYREIYVYPNPAKNRIYLSGIATPVDLQVIDISGKTLIQELDKSELDISSLKPGLYYIKIQLTDKEICRKLIKE